MIRETTISPALYEEVYDTFPRHSIYHTSEWHEVLARSFGWKVQALTERGAGQQLNLFVPFVRKRGMNMKMKSIGLPLSHHVPVLTQPGASFPAAEILGACGSPLELKADVPWEDDAVKRVVHNDLALLDLDAFGDEEELFRVLHKSSIQRKVKKAVREGVVVTEESDDEAFEVFYDMEVETRMRQGSPIYPSRFFLHLKEAFEETGKVKLFMARVEGRPAAGIIFLFHGDTAIYAYGGSYSNTDWFRMGVNQAAMWAAVKYAFQNGFRTLDFGTSPRSQPSLLDYKLKWGAEKVELPTSFVFPAGAEPPVIDREGPLSRLVSTGIRALPKPLFKSLTPTLLKLAL